MSDIRSNTENNSDFSISVGIAGLIGVALFTVFCLWFFPKFGSFWTNTLFPEEDLFCSSLKKIVAADPIYEDNGKYEDEAYKVKYEDGSIGLVDNASLQSGYYCVSQAWMKVSDAKAKGWVLKP